MGLDPAFTANPQATWAALDYLDSEQRLIDYIPLAWPVLEPGRKYIYGYAIEAICDHLEAVSRDEIKRLVINVPPGCMKSLTTEVLWPTWEWGPQNMPYLRYVRGSYSDALTMRDNLKARRLIQSPWYQGLWGDRVQLTLDQNAKGKFETTQTGFMIATSVGGLGTGERGDRFVIDDPHNIKDGESVAKREEALQWFSNVVPTRVNDPAKSAIIVIMQRVHDQDVSGLILKEELGYEWLCLPMEYERVMTCYTPVKRYPEQQPTRVASLRRDGEPVPRWITPEELPAAMEESPYDHTGKPFEPKWRDLYDQDWRSTEGEWLWPERFTPYHVEEELKPQLRAWGGSYAEAGQLQQRPAPREGGMFQRKDFTIIDHVPDDIFAVVRGWDLASSKDKRSAFTVGLKMGLCHSGMVVVLDVYREQATPHVVDEAIKTCAQQDHPQGEQDLPQDPGQAGVHQKAHIGALLAGYGFHFSPESGSKEDRAKPLASQAEAGNLYLIRASWNDALINEYCLFPNGEWLDQVDAGSRTYMRLSMKKPVRVATGGVRVVAA
jgi:predicted phage terminase large subunit-like protein